MPKFNQTARGANSKTLNETGMVVSKRRDARRELVSIVLSALLNDKNAEFYSSDSKVMRNMLDAAAMVDPIFLAKLAIFTRNEMGLRSAAHVLSVALIEKLRGKPELRKTLRRIMRRPDDATEMVALWNAVAEESLPNALRRAVRDRLENGWDAYQLRKYFGQANQIKVSDLVKLAHPTPKNDEQALMFKQAIEGTLPLIETAQTVNTETGGSARERSRAYVHMIRNGKLGYMALLKNLTAIVSGAKEKWLDEVAEALVNEKAIIGSSVLPFRFLQAMKSLVKNGGNEKIEKALEKAFRISGRHFLMEGCKITKGRTLFMVDESGSMSGQPFEIAMSMSAAAVAADKKKKVEVMFWGGNNDRDLRFADIKRKKALHFAAKAKSSGWVTNLAAAFRFLEKNGKKYDRIVVFTDMQFNSANPANAIRSYRKTMNKNVQILFWNVAPYRGGTPLALSDSILEINGFAFVLLEVAGCLFKNPDALLDRIESVRI